MIKIIDLRTYFDQQVKNDLKLIVTFEKLQLFKEVTIQLVAC